MIKVEGAPDFDALAEARLSCIQVAIKNNLKPQADWADWLKKGIKLVEEGGNPTPEWLTEIDKENSYI